MKIKVGETKYPVYVRVRLVFNWQEKGKEDEAFYYAPPKESDYSLSIDQKWMYNEGDGFYYYIEPVASKGTTDVLIKECQPLSSPPNGYELSVNIITHTVQAVGHTDNDKFKAVFNALGVDLSQISNQGLSQ